MKTAKFLFWLGVLVMAVELVANLSTIVRIVSVHAIGLNWGTSVTLLFGGFSQGGVLIGLGKILEALQNKKAT